MIATNALLEVGFSMVAAFAHVVNMPEQEIPRNTNDLHRYMAGVLTPTGLFLYTKNEASYQIGHGIVQMFSCHDSYFNSEHSSGDPRFKGTAIMTSNEVVEYASSVLQGLVKSGDPLANCRTNVICADGDIPFYEIQWFRTGKYRDKVPGAQPATYQIGSSASATVE
jgi:hypothetical protein